MEYSQIISVLSVDSVAIYHDFDLGPVNTCMIAALLPEIRPGKARGAKFSGTK
jgi:hypothetical protein